MIINIKLDYNPETDTCKVLKTEVEKPVVKKVIPESTDPQLTLESGKYSLNPASIELMQVEPNVRIDIKYQVIDGIECPVIGTEEAFGSGGGNKLTKAYTVVYRGKANERLAKFGDVFTLTPLKGSPGLFVLVGNGMPEIIPDDIEIKEDMTNNTDLVDMDDEPLTFEDDSDFEDEAEVIDETALNFN